MTIQWTGTGGLFTRLGRIGYPAYLLNTNQPAFLAALNQILLQYDSSLEDVVATLAVQAPGLVRSTSTLQALASQLGQQTVTEQVALDQPIRGQNFLSALNEVIRQMLVNGITVNRCTITTAAATQAGNTGVGVVVLSTKRGDGLVQENTVNESALLICTADSYTGGATPYQEQFQFLGSPNSGNTWDWDWPQGSAANQLLNAVSSAQYGSLSGNLLTNGDFEQWQAGPPLAPSSGWTLTTGAWMVDAQQTTADYTGVYALQLNASGVKAALVQPFGSGAGTNPTLGPLKSYAVNLWVRAGSVNGSPIGLLLPLTQNGTPITAGTIVVELVDGNGNATTDQQGVTNSFTIDATKLPLTGIYQSFNGTFRTPQILPATGLQLRIREGTALVGGSVVIDSVAMTPMTATYPGGPGIALFSGNVPYLLNDAYTIQATNDRAGAVYCTTFQALFDRLFGMRALNLLLPSSLTPSVTDTLITGANGTPFGLLLSITRP